MNKTNMNRKNRKKRRLDIFNIAISFSDITHFIVEYNNKYVNPRYQFCTSKHVQTKKKIFF